MEVEITFDEKDYGPDVTSQLTGDAAFDGDYNAPGNSSQAGKEMRGKEKRGTSSRGKEKMVRRFHPYSKP